MTIKAIIFDVDGTLADTEEAHREAFNQTFQEEGLPWFWDVALYAELLRVTGGKERMHHYVGKYLPHPPNGYSEEFIRYLHEKKTELYARKIASGLVPLRPGIEALIRQARSLSVRLAIATTTSPENVSALLACTLGADWRSFFEVLGCGDVVPCKKPASDIYHWVLDRLLIPAESCVAFEDSVNGLRSSLGAGLRTHITTNAYTKDQDFTGAARTTEDLSDLDAVYAWLGKPFA